jgi:hypothetical protein
MLNRRAFLRGTAVSAVFGAARTQADAPAGALPTKSAGKFHFSKIAGSPRERGRAYGRQFGDGIRSFLDKEIFGAFSGKVFPKDEMLRYAAACGKSIESNCPIIHEELGGMAEGSGIPFEELVLITLHEELYHKGVLPKLPHCTASAAGPPDTAGDTYVGQTWDWMTSVAGLSSMVHWKRPKDLMCWVTDFPGFGSGLA